MDRPVRYVRRPFYVMAMKVTEANIDQVAVWCGGKVHRGGASGDQYIKLTKVLKPENDRQTRAFKGNFVLQSGDYFKVYSETSFKKSFRNAEVREE